MNMATGFWSLCWDPRWTRRLSDLTLFGCKSLDDDQLSLSNSLNRPAIRLVR